MDDHSRGGRVGALLLVCCAPMATWWLVGDLSEQGGDYYLLKPLKLKFGDEAVFGLVAVGHFLAGMLSLWMSLVLIAVIMMVPIVGIGRGSLRQTL